MKKAKIIKTYIIPDVKVMREGGHDDFTEQAEDQLDEIKHFQSMRVLEECCENGFFGEKHDCQKQYEKTQSLSDWMQEFDKRFKELVNKRTDGRQSAAEIEIKDFIASLLYQQREALKNAQEEKRVLICHENSHVFDKQLVEQCENFTCACGKQTGSKAKEGGLV